MRLARRVVAGARVEHPQQVRERRDAADRRAGRGRPALLLERHGRRQAVDLVDLGHAHLVEQPPRVGRDRLEVAPLRLGVERAERERRLARAGDAGEHDQGVARDVEVDVLEVVLARPAHADEAVGPGGRSGKGAVGMFHRGHSPSRAVSRPVLVILQRLAIAKGMPQAVSSSGRRHWLATSGRCPRASGIGRRGRPRPSARHPEGTLPPPCRSPIRLATGTGRGPRLASFSGSTHARSGRRPWFVPGSRPRRFTRKRLAPRRARRRKGLCTCRSINRRITASSRFAN